MNKKNIISIASILCLFLIPGTSIGEINTGQTAPNFNLQDQNGEWHTLDNYKGKWVVLFFIQRIRHQAVQLKHATSETIFLNSKTQCSNTWRKSRRC